VSAVPRAGAATLPAKASAVALLLPLPPPPQPDNVNAQETASAEEARQAMGRFMVEVAPATRNGKRARMRETRSFHCQ
jgi:hypothetical protein